MDSVTKYITDSIKIVKNNSASHDIDQRQPDNIFNADYPPADTKNFIELFRDNKSRLQRSTLFPPKRRSSVLTSAKFLKKFDEIVKARDNHQQQFLHHQIKNQKFISRDELVEKMGPQFCVNEITAIA